MIKNALVNKDGSIIDFFGSEILPPDEKRAETYSKMKDFKNAWVNKDGSVVKIVKAGGGTGESTPNIAIEYDTETGKVWITDKYGKKESMNSIKLDTITDSDGKKLEEILQGIKACDIGFDKSDTDIKSDNVQGAIVEISNKIKNTDINVSGGVGWLPIGTVVPIARRKDEREDEFVFNGNRFIKCDGKEIYKSDCPLLEGLEGVSAVGESVITKPMTLAEQYGQLVKATSEINSSYKAISAFDNTPGTSSGCWFPKTYSSGVDKTISGEWIAIRLDKAVVVAYFEFLVRNYGGYATANRFRLWGANDLDEITEMMDISKYALIVEYNDKGAEMEPNKKYFYNCPNNNTPYRYYIFEVLGNDMRATGSNLLAGVGDLQFYSATEKLQLPNLGVNSVNQSYYIVAENI